MTRDSDVGELQALGLDDLRRVWAARYGAPPKLRSPEILRLMLAWRMQAEVEGGLDPNVRRQLRCLRKETPRARPMPGTRLGREWKGVRHEVVVVADGTVLYHGEQYASLSEVARKITGARWNGPRFFGLRGGEAAR